MRLVHPHRAALITTAPESADEEYERRRKRYAIMMAVRGACVLAAALTYRVSIILALVCLLAGAVLPWCAVILANDGPPKRKVKDLGGLANHERRLPPGDSARTIDQ